MPASSIIVSYKDGSPGSNKRVVLGFSSGQSEVVYTDRYGKAVIEHSVTGSATVYVSGNNEGSFYAPGKYAVILR